MPQFNWLIDNLEMALAMWNARLQEIWQLLTMSLENFKGGGIWDVIVTINDAMKGIGFGLLVLFFVMGVMKTTGSFTDLKRPEAAFKLFIRFVIAQALVSYGMDIMLALFGIAGGAATSIMNASGIDMVTATTLPEEIITAINNLGFFESLPLWFVTLLGSLVVWILTFIMILTVYGRFFKIYIATAIAPIALSSFAGQPTESIGKNFLQTYAALCLQGCIIILGCIIFSVFASTPPALSEGVSTVTLVWNYVAELVFNMLVLVGTIKMSDRLIGQLFGFH